MNERGRAPALQHPIRRDRRIDSARQQACDATGGTSRQSTGATFLAEEIERVAGEQLYMNGEFAIIEVNLPAACLPDAAADLAFNLRRGHRKALVRAFDAHSKTAAGPVAEVFENRTSDDVDVE